MSNPINEEESKLLYEEFFKKDTAMATIFGLEVLSAMNEESEVIANNAIQSLEDASKSYELFVETFVPQFEALNKTDQKLIFKIIKDQQTLAKFRESVEGSLFDKLVPQQAFSVPANHTLN